MQKIKKILPMIIIGSLIALKFSKVELVNGVKFSMLIPFFVLGPILKNKFEDTPKGGVSLFIITNIGTMLYLLSLIVGLVKPELMSESLKYSLMGLMFANILFSFFYYYFQSKDWQNALRMSLSKRTASIAIKEWKLMGASFRFFLSDINNPIALGKRKRLTVFSIFFSLIMFGFHWLTIQSGRPVFVHFVLLVVHLYFYQWVLGLIQLNREVIVQKRDDYYYFKGIFDEYLVSNNEIQKIVDYSNTKYTSSLKIRPLSQQSKVMLLKSKMTIQGFGRSREIDKIIF